MIKLKRTQIDEFDDNVNYGKVRALKEDISDVMNSKSDLKYRIKYNIWDSSYSVWKHTRL